MTSNADRIRTVKGYYDSLVGQKEILASQKDNPISEVRFNVVEEEIRRAQTDLPDLIPPYDRNKFVSPLGRNRYDNIAIQAYLAACVGRVKAALTDAQNTPVTERLEFSFVTDRGLRKIIERDFAEIQRAYITECWKSVIILSGGALEAILLDCLMIDESRSKAAKAAPSTKADLSKWDLFELIKVAVELDLVEPMVEALGNAVRQYRNLVHPGVELRRMLQVDQLEAEGALTALKIVHRDLSSRP